MSAPSSLMGWRTISIVGPLMTAANFVNAGALTFSADVLRSWFLFVLTSCVVFHLSVHYFRDVFLHLDQHCVVFFTASNVLLFGSYFSNLTTWRVFLSHGPAMNASIFFLGLIPLSFWKLTQHSWYADSICLGCWTHCSASTSAVCC